MSRARHARRERTTWAGIAVISSIALLGSVPAESRAEATQTTVEVFARGLHNPRGIAVDAGKVYVAEAGALGDVWIRLPVVYGGRGPIGTSGRVLELSARGGEVHTRVLAERLPNFAAYAGVEMMGVHGVAAHDGAVSYVTGGHPLVPPGLFTVQPDGSQRRVADFMAFNTRQPADASNGDAVPSGNPYDVVFMHGASYVSDGNYNRVIRVAPDGAASVFAQWSNSSVPVGLDGDEQGNLYVAQFGAAPYHPDSGRVDKISPDGRIEQGYLQRLQTPIDVAHTADGTLYVLQFASAFSTKTMRYVPAGGKLLRVRPGQRAAVPELVVSGMTFPTSIAAAADGSLYVSSYGMESNHGNGEILRIVPGDLPAVAPATALPPHAPTEADVLAEQKGEPDRGAPDTSTQVVEILETNDTSQWGYAPRELTVTVGQTVLFVNKGRMPHSVTNTAGSFDSGLIPPNGSYALTPQKAGDFEYLCAPHPWMRGALKVLPNPDRHAQSDDAVARAVQPRIIPPPRPTISVWAALALIPFLTLSALGVNRVIRHD